MLTMVTSGELCGFPLLGASDHPWLLWQQVFLVDISVNYGVFPPEGRSFFRLKSNPPGGHWRTRFFLFFFSMLYSGGVYPGGL